MIFMGGNIRIKSCPKTFWASLGKFGQKSFVPQNFACSYTYVGYDSQLKMKKKSSSSSDPPTKNVS